MGILKQIAFEAIACVTLGYIGYLAYTVYYRLYLHPLAKLKIPGPKLAAATFFYEFWWNVPKEGRYIYEIEKWHKQYGPIIRITPDEVHVNDPNDYDKIYNVGTKYYKDPAFYYSFGIQDSIFAMPSNSDHRTRRAALSPLFSPSAVRNNEWLVQKHVSRFLQRIQNYKPGQALDLHKAFRCISVDVITDYAFAKSYDLLLKEDFGASYFADIEELALGVWIFKMFPLVGLILFSLPMSITKILSAPAYTMMDLEAQCTKDIIAIKKDERATTHKTIFQQLLDPQATEGHTVPEVKVLAGEATIFVAAATETTGNALEATSFHVLKNPAIYRRLKQELVDAFPDATQELKLSELEKLPYLNACIREGLRLSYGVIGRLPRKVPEGGANFHGYDLPAYTTISCSAWNVHNNSDLFPSPRTFDPERWLSSENNKRLDRYLVSFSKGSRQCLGMNLAWAEMYITLGRVFRSYDLEVNPRSSKELTYRDCFSPFPPKGERGLLADVVFDEKKVAL